MSKIRVLPENLANQIAAGEVIERPASVVKELIENSIDSGATQIGVYIEGDGTRLIRIIDNGSGMDEDDVLLCLERHGTSKIRSLEELQNIMTLGFRGEALPSIASVSKLTITSRLRENPLGTRAEVAFGRVVRVHEIGCSEGTALEVKDLFGNVPARKKFIRSSRTELFHVEEVVKNYALAYGAITFSLSVNNSTILELPADDGSLANRARQFFCRNSGEQLIEVFSGDAGVTGAKNINVHGFLVPPDVALPGAARLRLFVNGRVVRDRMLSQAVYEGLQGFIMKGRKPSGVFFVDVPPDSVDVNVHPTKQEVRFRRNSDVQAVLSGAVRNAIVSFQGRLKYQLFGKPHEKGDLQDAQERTPENDIGQTVSQKLVSREPEIPYENKTQIVSGETATPGAGKTLTQLVSTSGQAGGLERNVPGLRFEKSPSREGLAEQKSRDLADSGKRRLSEGAEDKSGAVHVRFIGQLLETYILCESDEGLLAIDQHAAHERLLFEILKKQVVGNTMPSQTLLFPTVVEFSPEAMQLLQKFQAQLGRFGVAFQDFGGTSIIIKAVPAILAHLSPGEIMAEFVGLLEAAGNLKEFSVSILDNILSSMACKAAIKAGQRLEPVEAEDLLRQLIRADIFSHCPHGRPVAKHFSSYDLKRWFHRG